jgi:hypothetical protein
LGAWEKSGACESKYFAGGGLILQLLLPTDAKNPSDATAKIRLIERELKDEWRKN